MQSEEKQEEMLILACNTILRVIMMMSALRYAQFKQRIHRKKVLYFRRPRLIHVILSGLEVGCKEDHEDGAEKTVYVELPLRCLSS